MYTLRPYQTEAVEQAIHHFNRPKKAPFIIQAATGAGKSLIIAEICHRLDKPVLILQPSKEILEQNYNKLLSYGVGDIGIYSASKGRKEIAKYTYATIGSIYKKPEQFKHFQYVIIDECHGLDPKNVRGMLTSFLKAIGCDNVCGLTATPYRIVSKYFTDERGNLFYTAKLSVLNRIYPFFFKKIVYKVETADLIEQGYLSPVEYFVDRVDTSALRVNSTGRDFTEDSLEEFSQKNDRKARICAAIEYAHQFHVKSLTFCSSIKQAGKISEMLHIQSGIAAPVVTGKTPMRVREQIIEDYRQGKVKHLLNVGVFTTGFDIPELDCIIMGRTTMSLALYYQMIGRGVRIDPANPSKVLKVYDLAGVVERLGRVETIRVKTEKGGFREEIWSEQGRMDETPLFEWFVKKKPNFVKG